MTADTIAELERLFGFETETERFHLEGCFVTTANMRIGPSRFAQRRHHDHLSEGDAARQLLAEAALSTLRHVAAELSRDGVAELLEQS